MTDHNSTSTSATSPTSNESCSTVSTEEKTPRKVVGGDGLKSRTFRIPSHCDTIMQVLNRQRVTGEFCDITVLIEHQRFSAHKSVLAANSPYFKSLLATGNDGIFLRHITSESFAAILDFMYTSRLHLESSSVQDVLSAAKFLQVKGVVSICCRYLESQIRVLTKDFENRNSKVYKQPMYAADTENLKMGVFPSLSPLQQQPQLTYNPNTGVFVPDIPMNSTLKPIVVGSDSHHPPAMMSYQQSRPLNSTLQPAPAQYYNPSSNFSNPAPQNFALKHRNLNPISHPVGNLLSNPPASIIARPGVLPSGSYHVANQGMGPAASYYSTAGQQPNYPMSYFPNEEKGNIFSAGPNPYQFGAPPNHSGNPNMGAHMYGSKSTAGKGRRQHLPARRKGGYGPVSAGTQSLKFSFGRGKVFPSTSTPRDKKSESDNATTEGQIVLLSSARDSKSGRDKKSASPETVFDVEAEDRYWDALSTKARSTKNESS